MDTLVEQLKLFDIRLKSGASSPCGTDDFKNADINMYNVLLELIYICTPHQCEAIINEHVVDIPLKELLLSELNRFYAVGESLKNKYYGIVDKSKTW